MLRVGTVLGASAAAVLLAAGSSPSAKVSPAPALAVAHPPATQIAGASVVIPIRRGAVKAVRLEAIGDSIIRVTASPTGQFDVVNLMASPAVPAGRFTVEERKGARLVRLPRISAEVSTATGAITFRDAEGRVLLAGRDAGRFLPASGEKAGLYAIRQRFVVAPDEAFYGLGQHQKGQMNYRGHDVELAQHNMDVAVPFVVSSRNYGVLWQNNSITRFGDPRPYQPASATLKVVGPDGKPGFQAQYFGPSVKITGSTPGNRLGGQDLTPVYTRQERDIDFQYIPDLKGWPAEQPAKSTQKVVWEGRVSSQVAGRHKFQIYSSGYIKVFVDGQLQIDAWRQSWNPWYRDFAVDLKPGKSRDIRVEWIPEGGYAALLHQDPLPTAESQDLQLSSEVAKAIDYYVVAGDNLDQVVAGYRRITGKATMLPRWAYGFWQSRDRYETADQLLGVVKSYRDLHIPLDNIVQDWSYWPEDGWGSHDFDRTRYPDPKKMVDQVHALNAHLMISVWPKFYPNTANYKELAAGGHVYPRNIEVGEKDWIGSGYLSTFYDPYSPQARDIYWRQIDEKLKRIGLDAWWLDASEPDVQSNLSPDERKLRAGPTALGSGGEVFNAYPLMHTTAVYEGSRKSDPDRRVFILTRSAFAGNQRNAAATWSGDVVARWSDLHEQISAGINMGLSGIPNWTFDIGGYDHEARYQPDVIHGEDLDEWRELNLRWFQFGSFAPLFRSHGKPPFREVYNISPAGSEMRESMVYYDRLRYRLMPYIYTLAAETWRRDGTIMRGLVMDFPSDPKVRDLGDEYMFGPAFLVSPVTTYKARERQVYLPAGERWYDFYTGRAFAGGQAVAAAAPFSRMPLFVRAGSIVPTGPEIEWTAQKPDGPITLYVYTGKDGRFDLYEDDGVTYAYERGSGAVIPIRYDDRTGEVSLGARAGEYAGMPGKRTIRVRWIAGPSPMAAEFNAPAETSVEYDGRPVNIPRPHR